jgi:hypothetical protein
MISSIDPPPAYEVVGGLNRLAKDISARTIPNRYPSGDHLSSELGGHLANLVSLEARFANLVSAGVHELEMILLVTIQATQSVDYFPAQPSESSTGPGTS